jgi:sugar phosphate permease
MLLVKYSRKDFVCRKWSTYIITFMAYVSLHTMRMSYAQVKTDFQKAFDLSNLYLGLFDALVYISLGLGFFLRFLIQGNLNLVSSYAIFISFASLAYLIIPVTHLAFQEEVKEHSLLREVLPSIGLLLFGFCQFPAWPTLLTLTNDHFDLKKDGKAIGIWSANGDLGNIVGFAMTGLMVDYLNLQWELPMIAAATFNFLMGLAVVFFVGEK